MLSLTYQDRPNFQEYEENIGAAGNFLYIDALRYQFGLTEFASCYTSALNRLQDYIRVLSNGDLNQINSESVRIILEQYLGIDSSHFIIRDKGTKRISMDMVKVVNPLLSYLETRALNGNSLPMTLAYVLLRAYKDFAYYKIKTQNGRTKIKRFVKTDEQSFEGLQLSKVNFCYERQSTGRYYTYGDNVQGYDKLLVSAFTVPKDYFLVWADFAQIDFRVCYHIILREIGSKYDEFYRKYPDKYEAIARAIWDFCGEEFDEEAFKADRKGIKQSILARVYGAGLNTISPNFKDKKMASMLDKYIANNKGHQQYSSVINRAMEFGVSITAEDYFGVTREIPIASGSFDSALNSPIQSTSNSIVMNWTNNIIREFRECGWDEEYARVYLIRHDETLFMIHKDAMRDSWIFKDNSQIKVDNWDILDVELDMGHYYTIRSQDAWDLYEESCRNNEDKIKSAEDKPRLSPYHPIKDVLYSYCYTPRTLQGFAKSFLSNAPEGKILLEMQEESERMQWLHTGIQSGAIPVGSNLWYYDKYYLQYLVVHPDGKHWTKVKSLKKVVDLAGETNCGYVDIKCVDATINNAVGDVYIKYRCSNMQNILKMFEKYENEGLSMNEWHLFEGNFQW